MIPPDHPICEMYLSPIEVRTLMRLALGETMHVKALELVAPRLIVLKFAGYTGDDARIDVYGREWLKLAGVTMRVRL